MNPLRTPVLLLLVLFGTACGGKPKDAATTTTEPSSQSYPPQNPGDESASDTLKVAPSASTSAATGQPESGSK